MTAGDQESGERRDGIAVLERRREQVPLHVMDSQQRNVLREREGLPVTHSNQQRTYQSGGVGDGDRVETFEARARFFDRALDYRHDAREVGARRDLGHDAAKDAMDILRQDHQRLLGDIVAGSLEHGSGCLVARSLDSQNARHDYSMRSVSSRSTSARASGVFQSVAVISFFLMTPSLPTMKVSGYPEMSYASTILPVAS